MADQINSEELKWVLPETFPSINQILDPAHEINIRCLIKETNRFEKQNSNEMALVKDWEKNKQNSILTQQQREDYVGVFASNLANSFRSHSMFEPEAIRLFLA
ncbi:MAG: hypothetical protein JKY51_01885 [Opitutaceae bacterium]|nr:hypothetical protein [Opitutaceae bacterium]